MSIARVEPLTTARALRGPFDYLIPEEMARIGVGTVLQVPFGRRRLTGVVTGVADRSEIPAERLAEPLRVLGDGTTPELVELGLWLAAEYCSTPARGLGLVLPPGTGTGGERTRARTEKLSSLTDAGREALEDGTRLGSRQRLVLRSLLEGDLTGRELAARAGADSSTLKRIEARGWIRRQDVTVRRRPDGAAVGAAAVAAPELMPDQAKAVERLISRLDGPGEPGETLLNGVTGSGKTEVYLAVVEEVLARGRTAIVLVPEIGLTPQAVGRFQARLGDRVAVLHSALSAGQRFDEWQRLKSGEARVCVGPRSAVLAPVADLGLIVIDEEHDPSYKQEGDPRYDARDVARHRTAANGALLVLGTATPRPETWRRVDRIELPERVDGRGMPPVELIDMRGADPRNGPIHPKTMAALAEVRERGEKAIVMINRRGFAPWLTCQTCGHHWGCPNCDVSLIVHRESDQLICHHCNHAEPLPRVCGCGGTTLAQSGAGTQRIERLLAEELAPMPVFRLDADTTGGPGGHVRILAAFDQASSAILVGTQMVAKGHDFPEVTLSAILDADATLRFPDFRAEERTFSLVTQLAGRSGRGKAGGRVIVQTLAPGAPSIASAARHDSAGFLAGELERREALSYPPFSHLIRIQMAAEDEAVLDRAADRVADRLAAALPPDTDLLGPAPMFRARNRYRRRFLVKSPTRGEAAETVRREIESLVRDRAFNRVTLAIDVDPQ